MVRRLRQRLKSHPCRRDAAGLCQGMSGQFGQRGQQQDVGGDFAERIQDELSGVALAAWGEDRGESFP